MGVAISADALLANYLQGFLWADEDWLEVDGASATYWQARLAQNTTVDVLPDGATKWRIRTRIVNAVPEGADAHRICLALNRYAAGWSFAYNASERTIDAIVAISAPPEWDTFFLRLSEKAKLSAWMSEVLAERLAEAVGGVAAFSHPRAQPGLREFFDGTYYYLQTLRARPEWILDLTRYQFPSVEDAAATIAKLVGVAAGDVSCDPDGMRLPVGAGVHLEAGFDHHEIVGDSWRSALSIPCLGVSETLAEGLGAISWRLFDDPKTNLLGGWHHDGKTLVYEQWNTMSEVRNQEQLGSYHGRHTEVSLWGFTSTLSDVLGEMAQTPLVTAFDGHEGGDAADRAAQVVAAIAEQARPAVSQRAPRGDEPADRRLLWLERRRILAVAAWFNPMGPTITSTEICALPDGTEYVVHFQRHPLAPYYCVLGPLTDGDDTALMNEATELLVAGSLPNVLTLWGNPEATVADVPDALRDRILACVADDATGLAGDAAWIEQTKGNPWEFAAVDQTGAERVKVAAQEAAKAHPAPDGGFGAWWQQVSGFGNVLPNFRVLPDAWDGSLNTQRACNNLQLFDVDPLVVTYSKIGMPGAGADPSKS
jgi:hypothetical protein